MTLTAVHDRRGEVQQWVAVRRDLTQLRAAEEAARVSDRMASVGTLAAGLAHEINDPLTYVLTNLTFAVESLEGSSPGSPEAVEFLDGLRSTLSDAREGAQRMHDIITDLKTFSRSDDETMGPVDVNGVIRSSVKIVNNQIRHRAVLVCNLQTIPPVHGNASKLGQVFVNVLVNAAQAMPEGSARENQIRIRTSSTDGVVKVDISDTGSGMSRDVLARAFDPLFTTKEVGEGTGLGLSICHDIITAMGGAIDAHSQPSEGTRLQIVLPVCEDQISEEEPAVTRTRAKTVTARVLVVDDEPQVRKSLARILHDCQVDHAENGAVALERMRMQRYDLVLCDLMMPDVTGMDLYDRVV
jgi:signal transduction histidine kinase